MADERRDFVRGAREEKLFIKANLASTDAAETLACKSLDVSAHGIKIVAEQELDMGAQLQLWINIEGAERTFFLHGLVRWVLPSVDGYVCGVEFIGQSDDESEPDDMKDWQAFFV